MGTCFAECWKCAKCHHRWIKTELWPNQCAKCRSRKWNDDAKVASAIDSTPEAVSSPVASIEPVAVPVSNLAALPVADRKAAVLASLAGLGVTTAARAEVEPATLKAPAHVPVMAPVEREPCPYREPDMETGDVYGCALHLGHKGKHVRGPKVGDIW